MSRHPRAYRLVFALVAAAFAPAGLCQPSQAQDASSYVFFSLPTSAAVLNFLPWSINNEGQLSGEVTLQTQYGDTSEGVLCTAGALSYYSQIGDYESVENVYGLNDSGDVVGQTNLLQGWSSEGLIISDPYAPNTIVYGVNDSGTYVGSGYGGAFDASRYLAFTLSSNGTFNYYAPPFAIDNQSCSAYGINSAGSVVGICGENASQSDSSNGFYGYLYSGGSYTNLIFPNSIETIAYAINDSNTVVGAYLDSAEGEHGFIYSNGSFSTLDYPGGTDTILTGIDDAGTVVGNYLTADNSDISGFIATATSAPPAPSISPNSGAISSAQAIALTDQDANAWIFYTTDGSAPTFFSARYTGPFTLSGNATVNATAVSKEYLTSEVNSASFTINQQINPAPPPPPVFGTRFDFNADGNADLIWYNTVSGDLSVWDMNDQTVLNYGDTLTRLDPGSGWIPVACPDVNGDGVPNILWWNDHSGAMSFWTLAAGLLPTVTGYGSAFATVADTTWKPVAAADVTGTTWELVLQNSSTGNISAWQMNGETVTSYGGVLGSLGANSPWQVVGAPDLDSDQHSDLLFWNSQTGEVAWWGCNLQNQQILSYNGDFAQVGPPWRLMGSEDTNHDGHDDLIWWNSQTGVESRWLLDGTKVTDYGTTTTQVGDTTWQPTAIR